MVRCSKAATAVIEEIAASSPEIYVEISTAVKVIKQHGFVGENRVAILNYQYDVYLVRPASPGLPMIVLHNPADRGEAILTNIGRFSDATEQQRKQLAMRGANAIGLTVTDILVIRK